MNHAHRALYALLLAVLLIGCTSAPQNPREVTVASYGTILTLAESVESARQSGVVSDSQAQRAKVELQRAHDLVTAGYQAIRAGEDVRGDSLLHQAGTVLQIVIVMLEGIEQ